MTKGENGVWAVTIDPVRPARTGTTSAWMASPPYRSAQSGGQRIQQQRLEPRRPFPARSGWTRRTCRMARSPPSPTIRPRSAGSAGCTSTRRRAMRTGKAVPVFYLLHGAGDSDDAWSSVGRAGFILDNLIAAGKAKPMIVVMPAGHTRAVPFGGPPPPPVAPPADEFEQEFLKDIMPSVEKNYRVLADRKHRAIAGLSMGGGQTLNLAIPHQDKFAYVGVFSSGLFGAFPIPAARVTRSPLTASARSPWEEQHLAELDNADWKKGLKLLWFSTGKDDFLLQTTRSTVDLLKKHGFNVYEESFRAGIPGSTGATT